MRYATTVPTFLAEWAAADVQQTEGYRSAARPGLDVRRQALK